MIEWTFCLSTLNRPIRLVSSHLTRFEELEVFHWHYFTISWTTCLKYCLDKTKMIISTSNDHLYTRNSIHPSISIPACPRAPSNRPSIHPSINHPLSILLWGRWLLPCWLSLAMRAVSCSQARSPSALQPWFASWKRRVNQQRKSLRGHRNQGITLPHAAFLVNRSPFRIPQSVIFIFQHRAADQRKPSKGWRVLEETLSDARCAPSSIWDLR